MKLKKGWVVALVIISALSVLLTQVQSVRATFGKMHVALVLLRFETEIMQKTPAGRYYESLYWKHNDEIVAIAYKHPDHVIETSEVTRMFVPELEALLDGKGDTAYITPQHIESLKAELAWFASVGSPALQEDIQRELQRFPLDQFVGMSLSEALDYVNLNWTPGSAVPKSFVPGSSGKWAYYTYNGVYFEYPSSYNLQVSASEYGSIYLIPSASTPEDWNACVVKVRVFSAPPDKKDLYNPRTGYTPERVTWETKAGNAEFSGNTFATTSPDYPTAQIYSFQYNRTNNLVVIMSVFVYQNSAAPGYVDHSEMLTQRYEYFQHMLESLRVQL